jgi:hypothetical protein
MVILHLVKLNVVVHKTYSYMHVYTQEEEEEHPQGPVQSGVTSQNKLHHHPHSLASSGRDPAPRATLITKQTLACSLPL